MMVTSCSTIVTNNLWRHSRPTITVDSTWYKEATWTVNRHLPSPHRIRCFILKSLSNVIPRSRTLTIPWGWNLLFSTLKSLRIPPNPLPSPLQSPFPRFSVWCSTVWQATSPFGDSVIFYSPVAKLHRLVGTPKLPSVKIVWPNIRPSKLTSHIYTRMYLHTKPNPPCSKLFNLRQRSNADFKPNLLLNLSRPTTPHPSCTQWKTWNKNAGTEFSIPLIFSWTQLGVCTS